MLRSWAEYWGLVRDNRDVVMRHGGIRDLTADPQPRPLLGKAL